MSLLGIMLSDDGCEAFELNEAAKDWVQASAEASPPARAKGKAKSAAGVGRSVARGGKGTKFCEAC